jgi:hypothetical protein
MAGKVRSAEKSKVGGRVCLNFYLFIISSKIILSLTAESCVMDGVHKNRSSKACHQLKV